MFAPLYYAAKCGHLEMVKLLLDRGAKINPRDVSERRCLLVSSSYIKLCLIWWLSRHFCNVIIVIIDIVRLGMINFVMIWYNMIDYMIWYDMIWYDLIWHDMILFDMTWYNMIWYDLIWYDLIWLHSTWANDISHVMAMMFLIW